MHYTRKSGSFSKTDLGTTFSQSIVGSGKYFWEADDGSINAMYLVWSGTSNPGGTACLVHINLTTGDHYVLPVADLTNSASSLLIYQSFAYYNGKLYFSEYGGDHYTHCYCYDGAGTLNNFYTFAGSSEVGFFVSLSTDNKILFGTDHGVAIVNPSDLSTTYFDGDNNGLMIGGKVSQCNGLISDGTWLFGVWRLYGEAKYYATIYKLDGTSTSYIGDAGQYTSSCKIQPTTTGWQIELDGNYFNLTSSGSAPRSQTFNGEYTGPGSSGTTYSYDQYYRSTHKLVNQDYPNGNDGDLVAWDYEVGYDNNTAAPWEGNLSPYFSYRTPVGVGDWTDVVIDYGENIPYAIVYPYRVCPCGDNKIYVVTNAGSFMVEFDILTKAVSKYLGYSALSNYSPVGNLNGLYYFFGYSDILSVYDPEDSWTWTAFNTTTGNPHWVYNGVVLPKWPYYSTIADDGYLWTAGSPRDEGITNDVAYIDPTNANNKGGWPSLNARSIGKSQDGSMILVGDNASNLLVYDSATKALSKTIDLSTAAGFSGMVFVADVGTGDYALAIVSDESTNYKLLKINLITEGVTVINLPSGLPFGYNGSNDRINNKFVKGPDGEYYFFGGTSSKHLYAVDIDGNFTDLGDMGTYYMPTFVGNTLVLNTPESTHLYSIIDMFEQVFNNSAPLGIEGGQPGGMPGGKVDGI